MYIIFYHSGSAAFGSVCHFVYESLLTAESQYKGLSQNYEHARLVKVTHNSYEIIKDQGDIEKFD